MSQSVPLIRRFTTISSNARTGDVDLDETWLLHGWGDRVDWGGLLGQFRAVILADAGAGKTFELKAQAQSLIDSGRVAFFIRIEDIDVDFENALEIGTQNVFERWLNSSEEAWFFLDSVDEVRLETPRAFEVAMRTFAARIQNARHRAHIFISSRPYAWRTKLDGSLIDELLPSARAHAQSGETDARAGSETQGQALQIYRLEPLDRDQIRLFAGHRYVRNVNEFLDALDRNALHSLAQLPFDLEDLVVIWNETGALDGRLAVLERGLRHRLGGTRAILSILSLDRALEGARRLALAATVMGEANIRLPGGGGTGINASAVLSGWAENEVRELLSRGVFSDAIYSMVRFRHREIRELLAAQELTSALNRSQTRPEVERLIFREIYGEMVVVPRLRPLLPWLILFDRDIRDKTLALRAEIAIEGGDPAQLPLATREAILHDIVTGIINKTIRGGSNIEIARIARADLENTVHDILDLYSINDDVIFFIGRLVWQGSMRALADRLDSVATDTSRNIYARIVSIRAIMTVGSTSRRNNLWIKFCNAIEPLPHRLFAELVDNAPPDTESVEKIVELIEYLEPYNRFNATGIDQALHGFIDRLPMTRDSAVERPLAQLIDGLASYLFRESVVHQGRECCVSQEYSWLMVPAIHTVERLIIGRSGFGLATPVLDVLIQAHTLRHHGGFEDAKYKTKIADLVPRWTELNDALFWHAVARTREKQQTGEDPLIDHWRIA